MSVFEIPAESSGEIVPVGALENPLVQQGFAYWLRIRGARRFPAREQIVLREVGRLLRHVVLIRVLEDGADYEYRIVGDAVVQGFNDNFSGQRLSAIIARSEKFGLGLRMLYEMVRQSGEPVGYRGRAGEDMPSAEFVYHENALLPFGPDDAHVDHIFIISILIMRSQLVS